MCAMGSASNENKMSDGWRESASLRLAGGISWKVRSGGCQPFAPSASIYLTDRRCGAFCCLRRDKSGGALSLCWFVVLRFGRWARRFRDALYERLKALRSASAFASVARQSLKRFFACFSFLHMVFLLSGCQNQYFNPITTQISSSGCASMTRVSTAGFPIIASANSLCKVFAGSGMSPQLVTTVGFFTSPWIVITIPDPGPPPANRAGSIAVIVHPCSTNIPDNWCARLLVSVPIETNVIFTDPFAPKFNILSPLLRSIVRCSLRRLWSSSRDFSATAAFSRCLSVFCRSSSSFVFVLPSSIPSLVTRSLASDAATCCSLLPAFHDSQLKNAATSPAKRTQRTLATNQLRCALAAALKAGDALDESDWVCIAAIMLLAVGGSIIAALAIREANRRFNMRVRPMPSATSLSSGRGHHRPPLQ